MPVRLVPVVGTALGLVLAVVLVIGAAIGSPVLAAVAGGLLGTAVLAVQLDSWRRVRSLRTYLRDEIRASRAPAQPAAAVAGPSEADLLGAVQLLQAQYTGRLDRMQAALDDALARTGSQADHDPR
ncbi:hypothetical protein AVL62_14350 [Serinicoccus chungangensis]|uniref:Uncharacterized protein n=1 Tax=Serinicoccus chungangensis TaxID=767452 RepID=A0A0W8I3P7_9MICO|nr:hypothetical protein [Serinicoccus chungangensis]KUG52501.1 hypothetical protein AVL62_14350 [Serinicoccus chungangensis]